MRRDSRSNVVKNHKQKKASRKVSGNRLHSNMVCNVVRSEDIGAEGEEGEGGEGRSQMTAATTTRACPAKNSAQKLPACGYEWMN